MPTLVGIMICVATLIGVVVVNTISGRSPIVIDDLELASRFACHEHDLLQYHFKDGQTVLYYSGRLTSYKRRF